MVPINEHAAPTHDWRDEVKGLRDLLAATLRAAAAQEAVYEKGLLEMGRRLAEEDRHLVFIALREELAKVEWPEGVTR